MFMRRDMWFAWLGVSIFDEHLVYVSFNGYVIGYPGLLFSIISFKVDPFKFLTFLVGCYLLVLIQDFEEM